MSRETSWHNSVMRNVKAYLIAGVVFVALSAGLYAVGLNHYLQAFATERFLLGALFISVALLTVIIVQSFRVSADAAQMAATLAPGLATELLSSSHELFIELYRSSPVPYVLIDSHGIVLSTNMSAVRLFAMTEGDIDGKNIFDYLEGDNEQRVALFSEKLKAGLFVNDEEVRVLRKDGETNWVLCSLFSFKDSEGHRKGLLTLVDIAKQKQIDKAKSEFVSLASHQLRTPIATMKWNLELLMMKHGEEFSAEAKEYIATAGASIEQMNLLLSDFLNVSRFELGTLEHKKVPLQLSDFIEGVLKDHMSQIQTKNITLAKQFDARITSVSSDPRLLTMIVNNLISNAVKYTPEGGRLTLETSLGQNEIRIVVTDSGMGIPKDEQDRLFTKIFRASNATQSVPDGTGLGLYIVDQAVKVLGGSIVCVSEENKGATFTVTLLQ